MSSQILFILHLPPPIHGAAMVGKYIHDSRLINSTFECSYINLSTSKSLQEIGSVGVKKIIVYLKLLVNIYQTVRREKPLLCYVTPSASKMGFYKDFLVVALLKLMGKKVIIHYHNKGLSAWSNTFPHTVFCKYFYRDIKIILLAEELYADIKRYVRREDVFICPNGIPNIAVPLVKEKAENRISNILFLSNMMVEKGVWDLLEACSLMKSRGVRFRCHFVGKWSDITEEAFEKKVLMYQLQDYVTAYGGKYGEEKAKYFEQADVSVLPTYNDCFPLVLLEAMQYSLPCVSTNEGGIPSVIDDGKTGFIVEKKQPNVLADKLQWLIEHPDVCTKLGKAGKQKFEREFTLEQFEKRMIDILAQEIEK